MVSHVLPWLHCVEQEKAEMVEQMKTRGYPSDPVKAWKQQSITDQEEEQDSDEHAQAEEPSDAKGPDYSYLLSMQLLSLTRAEKEILKLLKNRVKKVGSLIH